jgi:hypothetical protein
VKTLRNPEYLESIKQNLLSGEWFLLFGDSLCVLSLLERLETTTHILAVGSSKIIMLTKKTGTFRELFGVNEEVARQIVAVSMIESGDFCMVFTFFGEEDSRRRVIDELIERLRKLGEDEESEEDEKPSTTTI